MEDITVVGAGPYGLSVAAHISAQGVKPRVFGRPMGFWESHMPRGMLVRSAWEASSIDDPSGRFSLDAYEARQPQPFSRPLPGEELTRYGRWFQEEAVPDVDRRLVRTVDRDGEGFALTLEDGERVHAQRVIIATGLRSFAHRPAQFDGLEDDLATHSMHLTEPDRFSGQSVVVIGSGQSAVETAALLSEASARVELVARASLIRWLVRGERLRQLDPILRRILYAPTDVGPAGLSRIVAKPELFRRFPVSTQERWAYRSIRPAATGWLIDRTADVKMTLERQVTAAQASGSGACLTLDDGSQRQVDHVVLATGYKIDARAEPVVGASIRDALQLHDGYPLLRRGLESSVPGLHFLGAYAYWSFGPIMRFVSGTKFASRSVAKQIARARGRRGRRVGASTEPKAVAESTASS
jgi:cation diffusion facilitator CzcD-associated flavoprotein CzcO